MSQPFFRWVSPSPFRFISLPNLVTYISFLSAVWAAQFAIDQNWRAAGAAIGVSALADMLDGKFARLFKRTPEEGRFGAELDSLIDVVAFGMAPLVCLRLYYFPEEKTAQLIWLVSAGWYLLATVTRLGYFNVFSQQSAGFVGLPTTFAGLFWSALFLVPDSLRYAPIFFLLFGVLMLLPVGFDRPRGWKFLFLPGTATAVILANLLR